MLLIDLIDYPSWAWIKIRITHLLHVAIVKWPIAVKLNLIFHQKLPQALKAYRGFIRSVQLSTTQYRLTPRADSTHFSLCFALFGLQLLRDYETLQNNAEPLAEALRKGVRGYQMKRMAFGDLRRDKPFLQLLTFTLSALKILERLDEDPLEDIIVPLLCRDVREYLGYVKALEGAPGSGNMAMFMAILLVHAKCHLGLKTDHLIEQWVDLHLIAMNHFGFFGGNGGMTYLQFQNGYHQYEIFEYLDIDNPRAEIAAANVAKLVDNSGHFAPYPGGSGCYDYDAVFVITCNGKTAANLYRPLLGRTAASILAEQNPDGGFADSQCVRPRSLRNIAANVRHVISAKGMVRMERLRHVLAFQLSKNNFIHSHWSTYSREWGESDLWDSWFRMLTLARIECFFDPMARNRWGFIDYPGIGYFKKINA